MSRPKSISLRSTRIYIIHLKMYFPIDTEKNTPLGNVWKASDTICGYRIVRR